MFVATKEKLVRWVAAFAILLVLAGPLAASPTYADCQTTGTGCGG